MWELANDEAITPDRRARHRDRDRGGGALGARRGTEPQARARVLLPLLRQRRGERGRPHAHRSAAGPVAGEPAVLPRQLLELGGGLLHRLQADRRGRSVVRRARRRLHLRGRPGHRRRCASTPTPSRWTSPGYRERHAQYNSDPDLLELRRLFPIVVTPDDHEVENNYAEPDLPGRHRARPGPEGVRQAARRRVPRVLRVHATAQRVAPAGLRHAALPRAADGRPRPHRRRRHAPVPHRPALQRPGPGQRAGHDDARRDAARHRAGAVDRGSDGRVQEHAGTSSPSRS